jgi:biotin synthase
MRDPMDWETLATRVIEGHQTTREEALTVALADTAELLPVMNAAFRVRRHFHGNEVKVHVLQNAKSGVCPEDCSFCSQSLKYNSDVPRYGMQDVDTLVAGARAAAQKGAVTYCMVTATRGPSGREIDTVTEAARRIKAEVPGIQLCASLGMLKEGQAQTLAAAGIDRYNHNLETSPAHFPNIVTTHGIEDRIATVRSAREAGMEACCGGILGMGETQSDWVDLALLLRELGVESVPLNFLDPRGGTPLADSERLTPAQALLALAMFRFVHPSADLRVAGGREVTLRSLQPMALYAANSIFTDGYLTTPGAAPSQDWQMIVDAGFVPAAGAA